jgi:hypothetical protein
MAQRCFAVFSFNDLEAYFPHPQTKRMGSRAAFHSQRMSESGQHSSNRDISVAYFDPANLSTPGELPWRKLAVQCGREGFDLFWEDQPAVHLSREQILNIFRAGNSKRLGTRMVPLFPELKPSYSSRDALGLYVAKGRASFRNVRVEPLTNR